MISSSRVVYRLALGACLCLAAACDAWTRVGGTVRTSAGAPVPGAKVSVTNLDAPGNAPAREIANTTSDSGTFALQLWLPGGTKPKFRLSIEALGFQPAQIEFRRGQEAGLPSVFMLTPARDTARRP
jgi:hypothetical protein